MSAWWAIPTQGALSTIDALRPDMRTRGAKIGEMKKTNTGEEYNTGFRLS
jgi:hypothetical protein